MTAEEVRVRPDFVTSYIQHAALLKEVLHYNKDTVNFLEVLLACMGYFVQAELLSSI